MREKGHKGIKIHHYSVMGVKEDAQHGSQGYSAENPAVIRHIDMNLLLREKKIKVGIKNQRRKTGVDSRYKCGENLGAEAIALVLRPLSLPRHKIILSLLACPQYKNRPDRSQGRDLTYRK